MGGAFCWRERVTKNSGVKGFTPFTDLETIDWQDTFLDDAMHLGKNLCGNLLNLLLGGPKYRKGLAGSLAFFNLHPEVVADVSKAPWPWPEPVRIRVCDFLQVDVTFPAAWSSDYKNIGVPSQSGNAKALKAHSQKALLECGLYTELAAFPRSTSYILPLL